MNPDVCGGMHEYIDEDEYLDIDGPEYDDDGEDDEDDGEEDSD